MPANVVDQFCLFQAQTKERSMPLEFRKETIATMEANCKEPDCLIQKQ